MPIAMYPGSFDPVTRGHLDIIKRSSRMFDTLIVAVLNNSAKTVNFAQQQHATVMVRGLRAVTDFENEIQLAHTNHALYPGIETVFLSTSLKWSYLSSTIVREAAHYNHDVSKFVTPNVEAALKKKIREGKV